MRFLNLFLILTTFQLLFLNLFAKDITPNYSLIASGGVTDILLKEDKFYIATTNSKIDIFDINSKNKIESIEIPKIKDFMGDLVNAKIYSIDILNETILILSEGEKGGKNIFTYKNGELKNIISDKERLFIAKAKFLDENYIVFALLSNQIYIYDIKNKSIKNDMQISESKFSNFKLNEDKNILVTVDESGIITILDSKNLNVIEKIKDQNLDNIFQVDVKNSIILTAGQDRRSVVYDMKKKDVYYKNHSFLIYSAGLSPSGNLAGVASDEENNVTIFNTKTKENLHLLKENKATLTNILFINENEIFVTSDDKQINYYKID